MKSHVWVIEEKVFVCGSDKFYFWGGNTNYYETRSEAMERIKEERSYYGMKFKKDLIRISKKSLNERYDEEELDY